MSRTRTGRAGVVAIQRGGVLCKLLSTRSGRLDAAAQRWPVPPEQLAAEHAADFAVVLESGCLDELMDRFAERIRPRDDYLAQLLALIGAASELEREQRLSTWPWRIAAWSLPSERSLLRLLDHVVPCGQSLVLGAFDASGLVTCVALRRGTTGFDRIVGPEALHPQPGAVGGGVLRDRKQLAAAVEALLGPIALGCYGEHATLRRLIAGPRAPGAWAAAALRREVVLAPAPAIIAVPLGIDLLRGVARRFSRPSSRGGSTRSRERLGAE